MVKKRVAAIGIRHEAMLACPFLTDISTTSVHYGADLLKLGVPALDGVFDIIAAEPDMEIVPLLFARTLPGGPFARGFYERIKAESVDLLRTNGPFDGVVIVNHGAAEVDGLDVHGDTDYVVAMRAALGPDVPISVPFDMHGQVTQELLDALTVMSCLRTAPHRDGYETSVRATKQLVSVMRSGNRPKKAAINIPIMAPGEKVMTDYSPAKELFGMLAEYDKLPGVVEAHLFVGFGWNDRPWCGMKAVVLTEDDEALALRYAAEIAEKAWSARRQFDLLMETAPVVEGLERARDDGRKKIYLSDSGDNVTAGAGGDLTFVLQDAIDLDLQDTVVAGIFAPMVVKQCRSAGPGSTLEIEIGHHISARPQPRKISVTVEGMGDAVDTSPYPGLRGSSAPWVRVRIGGIVATFHASRVDYTAPGHFLAVEIDPEAHSIYVVKVGYAHPQQEDMLTRHICLISEGVADLDFNRLTYENIRRPSFPMDADMAWGAAEGVFPRNSHLTPLLEAL